MESIGTRKRISIPGIVIRIALVTFALAGIHHFLRIISSPPPLSDLYPIWLGSREVLLQHHNPYMADTRREIEIAFYGAELGSGDHPDQQCCFAYPVYVSFLLAPAVYSDFPAVRLAAIVLLALLTAISVICWHAVSRGDKPNLAVIVPLVLLSPPIMQGLELRQPALLVAALLSFSAVLADHRHFALSGVTLALSTIKPQMSMLPIVWMLLWSAHNLAARKGLYIGFASAMAVFIGGGEIILPGWISDFLRQLPVYRHFAGSSMLEIVYGKRIGSPLVAVFVLCLLWVMWKRRTTADFIPTLTLILAMEVVVVPGLKSLLNLVLLIPAVFSLLAKYPATSSDTGDSQNNTADLSA